MKSKKTSKKPRVPKTHTVNLAKKYHEEVIGISKNIDATRRAIHLLEIHRQTFEAHLWEVIYKIKPKLKDLFCNLSFDTSEVSIHYGKACDAQVMIAAISTKGKKKSDKNKNKRKR